MSKVLGIPLKVAPDNSVYIPKTFLLHYGISANGTIIREEETDRVLFRRGSLETAMPTQKAMRTYHGKVHLRHVWLAQNGLAAGDPVWLIGTQDGLLIFPHPVNAII